MKRKLRTQIEYADLLKFVSDSFFDNWLDCDVDSSDLAEALEHGFEGKRFHHWEKIYGYGKDYEYLEDAYAIGKHARRFKTLDNFKKYYADDD